MIELAPLAMADAIAWGSKNLLGIGISTTAILALVMAFEGRKALKAGSLLGSWMKIGMLTLGLIGLLLALGILTGVNTDRAFELGRMIGDALGSLL